MTTARFVKGNTTPKPTTLTGTATLNVSKPAGPCAVRSLGPRQNHDTVIFVASFPQANAVHIAGEFNDWNPEKTPMKKQPDGTWQAAIHIKKGVYRYRLVVDGNWLQDLNNNSTEPNPYGGLNSVLRVA